MSPSFLPVRPSLQGGLLQRILPAGKLKFLRSIVHFSLRLVFGDTVMLDLADELVSPVLQNVKIVIC